MGYNGYSESRKAANRAYMDKQARVTIWMKPEEKKDIEERAKAAGKSVNQYIKDMIWTHMGT